MARTRLSRPPGMPASARSDDALRLRRESAQLPPRLSRLRHRTGHRDAGLRAALRPACLSCARAPGCGVMRSLPRRCSAWRAVPEAVTEVRHWLIDRAKEAGAGTRALGAIGLGATEAGAEWGGPPVHEPAGGGEGGGG